MQRTIILALLVSLLRINAFATVTTIQYTLNQQETCTLASLAATSGGSARSCAKVSNATNVDIEDQVWVVFKTGTAPNNSGTITVYGYGCSNDSTSNCTDAGEVVGTDANITLTQVGGQTFTNMPLMVGPVNCWANAASTTYRCGPFSVAQTWGGSVPSGWGVVIVNNSGQALDATCTGCGVFFDRLQLKNQ